MPGLITRDFFVSAEDDDTEFGPNNSNSVPSRATKISWGLDSKDGTQYWANFIFRNFSIPRGAKIVSASITGRAVDTLSIAGNSTQINLLAKGQKWETPNRIAWTRAHFLAFHYQAKSDVGASLGSWLTPVGTRLYGIRVDPRGNDGYMSEDKLGMSWTASASGDLGSAVLKLRRIGHPGPGGYVWAELWTQSGDLPASQATVSGQPVVSASVSANTISTGPQDVTFTFSPPYYQIVSGTKYAFVLNGDYAKNSSTFITWAGASWIYGQGNPSGSGNGWASSYGVGNGFSPNNFMSAQDVAWTAGNFYTPAGSVAWAPPTTWTGGVEYTTPDIGPMIQAWVNDASYNPNERICVRFTGGGTWGAIKNFAAYDHATYNPVKLTVAYSPGPIIRHKTVLIQ